MIILCLPIPGLSLTVCILVLSTSAKLLSIGVDSKETLLIKMKCGILSRLLKKIIEMNEIPTSTDLWS